MPIPAGCDLFTPSDGGSYVNNELGVSVGAGKEAVRDYICITAEEGEETTNGVEDQWLIHLEPKSYNINARDISGMLLKEYSLDAPSTVCVPITNGNGSNLSDTKMVAFQEDGTYERVQSKIRMNGVGLELCGEISSWSTRVGVAHQGTVNGFTSLTPAPAAPDTGGATLPASNGAKILLLILGIALAAFGFAIAKSLARRDH